jgi:hypothetical protein
VPKRSADETTGITALSSFENRLTNLLALLLVKDMKNQGDQIGWLNRAGFKASEIAALLGTTPNTVSVMLYQQKKPKKTMK